jgi:hypothetical protein
MLKLEPGLISNPIQGFRMLLAMMPAAADISVHRSTDRTRR